MIKIVLLLIILINVCFSTSISKSNFKKNVLFKDENIITTTEGKIRGKTTDTHRVFYGIPFASPPIGQYRFEVPRLPKPSMKNTIRDCTIQKEQCIQDCHLFEGACSLVGTSEDCLYLDIFVPRDIIPSDKSANVLVFIHGGSFRSGTGACPLYDGSKFANSSIILVNINYRVGALGFMSTDILGGNFGFLDQIRALEWVNENIESFGGNKNNITIYGQSAGSMSVVGHLISESSKGLFNRAIISSAPIGIGFKSKEYARGIANRYSNNIGCSLEDIECHRSKSTDQIIKAQTKLESLGGFGDRIIEGNLIWNLVIDGELITDQPLKLIKKGKFNDVSVIIGEVEHESIQFVYSFFRNKINLYQFKNIVSIIFGSNSNKVIKQYSPSSGTSQLDCRPILSTLLTDYLFHCPDRYVVSRLVEYQKTPSVYHYFYQHVTTGETNFKACEGFSCHSVDLPMVFNTYSSAMGYRLDEDEIIMANTLNNYWVNFVNTGDPNFGLKTSTHWNPINKHQNVSLTINQFAEFEQKDILSKNDKCDLFVDISSYMK